MKDGLGDLSSIKGELPIGLGMRLVQDRVAMDRYTELPDTETKSILRYVEGGATGDDAEERIARTVKNLHDGNIDFSMAPTASAAKQKRPSAL